MKNISIYELLKNLFKKQLNIGPFILFYFFKMFPENQLENFILQYQFFLQNHN